MAILVIILITIAFGTLAISISNVFGVIPENIIQQVKMTTLPAIAISSGVLIASITYFRDKAIQKSEKEQKSDEINLLLAKEGFDETYDLLKNLNNDRVTWIRAARSLYKSLELKAKIVSPLYIQSFEVAEERLRNQLYRLLQVAPEDSALSDKSSLPPQFFYGIENWKDTELTLDEAAIQAASPIKAYSVTIDKVTPEPKSQGLEESSIVGIYNFMKYPENYKDPLKDIEMWSGHYHDAFGLEQGPRRYISHKRDCFVSEGEVHASSKG
jgi:hypothetical protein